MRVSVNKWDQCPSSGGPTDEVLVSWRSTSCKSLFLNSIRRDKKSWRLLSVGMRQQRFPSNKNYNLDYQASLVDSCWTAIIEMFSVEGLLFPCVRNFNVNFIMIGANKEIHCQGSDTSDSTTN